MWKGAVDCRKAKRPSKEEIKKQLLESVIADEVVESDDLKKEVEKIREPDKAAEVIKRYEDVIRMKKKGIISIAYYQGKVLKDLKKRKSLLNLSLN